MAKISIYFAQSKQNKKKNQYLTPVVYISWQYTKRMETVDQIIQ